MTTRCKYFNGIQHITCLTGIKYSAVITASTPQGKAKIPCLNVILENCPKREMQTLQEVEAEIQAFAKAANDLDAKVSAGTCPICSKSLEPRSLVGRCFYGACGHRIGQTI